MPISVTDPISSAINRAKLITFRPFDLGKWFTLGFCAFLATLGDGGGSNFNFPGRGGGGTATGIPGSGQPIAVPGQPPNPFDPLMTWVSVHAVETVAIALVLLLIVLALAILLLWLSSRGRFMFLHGVVTNTAAIVEPWKRFATLANSYFRFRVMLALTSFGALLLIGCISLLLAWSDIHNQTFGSGAVASIIVGAVLLFPAFIAISVISWCANAFIIVIMYARNVPIGPAWLEFRTNVLANNVGSLILFLLMSGVFRLAIVLCSVVLGCCTLCLGFLPYLSSVLTLPLEVFSRSYSLYFLQQFGPQYQIVNEPPPLDYGFGVVMPQPPVQPPP